jgi:hypothetical protein
MNKWRRLVIRLRHWEYWNSKLVYFPLYPYWLWLSIKARSFYFITAANPGIKNGGLVMESKYDSYRILPAHLIPRTVLIHPGTPEEAVTQIAHEAGIAFPMIAKPDIGERGLAVKKIHDHAELERYARDMPVAYLLQEYISYPQEVGIFYSRYPGSASGRISGIVYKEPVTVSGDGVSTIAQLVAANDRYLLQWEQIKALHPHMSVDVPARGEQVVLVPYGNHSRGSRFTDQTFRATAKLNDAIDRICSSIPGFYYGRLDIRFESWELLEECQKCAIIEVNGSGSEPTHIYDPRHSLWFAWREITRHWHIAYTIGKANQQAGTRALTLKEGFREKKAFRKIEALLSQKVW